MVHCIEMWQKERKGLYVSKKGGGILANVGRCGRNEGRAMFSSDIIRVRDIFILSGGPLKSKLRFALTTHLSVGLSSHR